MKRFTELVSVSKLEYFTVVIELIPVVIELIRVMFSKLEKQSEGRMYQIHVICPFYKRE